MNKTLLYLQADMHRAINDKRRSLDVSVLDLKELISAVLKAEGREQSERCGHIFGWISPESLKKMREGDKLYCSIRRKKNEEYCNPVFCVPDGLKPVDANAEIDQNPTHNSDD